MTDMLAAVPVAPADGAVSLDAVPPSAEADRLLAEVTHDLRTPLTSARLLVEALKDGLVEEELRAEYLARIEEQISLLSTLVDELHLTARDHAGDDRSSREWVRPHELIAAAVEAMLIQAEARGVALEQDLSLHLPCIRANPIRLRRALLNLIENAIRHARPGGKVIIHAERGLGGVEIEVEDDGTGISIDEQDRVFTAFYGSDRRRSSTRSGLGLAIARATVEEHGGRIWLADSACGTRVRMSLPTPAQHRTARRGIPCGESSNDSLSPAARALKSR